jgi:hypothetical protein
MRKDIQAAVAKRNETTVAVAKLIMGGMDIDRPLRFAENQITFTMDGITYNVIVTVSRTQEVEK